MTFESQDKETVIHVDIETLAMTQDAAITDFAYVVQLPDGSELATEHIFMPGSLSANLSATTETYTWRLEHAQTPIEKAFLHEFIANRANKPTTSLPVGFLPSLINFIQRCAAAKEIWMRGKDFDYPILISNLDAVNKAMGERTALAEELENFRGLFRKVHCLRDLEYFTWPWLNQEQERELNRLKASRTGHHNAKSDASYQAYLYFKLKDLMKQNHEHPAAAIADKAHRA